MVGHFYAIRGAFLQQWRVTASVRELVLISIFQTPLAIGLGWVARSSDEPAVVATVAIGAGLMILWSMAVFYTGFAMVDELFGGTLELNMLSRSRSSSWSGTCSGSPRRAPNCRAVSWEGSDGIREELWGTGLEADQLCKQIAIINHGQVVATGTPAEIKRRFGQAVVVELRLKEARDSLEALLNAAPGVLRTEVGSDGFFQTAAVQLRPDADQRAVVAAVGEDSIESLQTRTASLEEAYLTLIEGEGASNND